MLNSRKIFESILSQLDLELNEAKVERTIDKKLWLTVSSICSKNKADQAENIKPIGATKTDKNNLLQRYVAALLIMKKPCPKTEADIENIKTFKYVAQQALSLGVTIQDIQKLYKENGGNIEISEPEDNIADEPEDNIADEPEISEPELPAEIRWENIDSDTKVKPVDQKAHTMRKPISRPNFAVEYDDEDNYEDEELDIQPLKINKPSLDNMPQLIKSLTVPLGTFNFFKPIINSLDYNGLCDAIDQIYSTIKATGNIEIDLGDYVHSLILVPAGCNYILGPSKWNTSTLEPIGDVQEHTADEAVLLYKSKIKSGNIETDVFEDYDDIQTFMKTLRREQGPTLRKLANILVKYSKKYIKNN